MRPILLACAAATMLWHPHRGHEQPAVPAPHLPLAGLPEPYDDVCDEAQHGVTACWSCENAGKETREQCEQWLQDTDQEDEGDDSQD